MTRLFTVRMPATATVWFLAEDYGDAHRQALALNGQFLGPQDHSTKVGTAPEQIEIEPTGKCCDLYDGMTILNAPTRDRRICLYCGGDPHQ